MSRADLTLSVLDFPGRMRDSLELAQHVERYGYHRYWWAEHAPQPNPILMAGMVGAVTKTLRVGTGGILFHSYSPARAAYDFQLLEDQYPGRIDAGFCGGWFPDRLVDDYLDGRPPECKSNSAGYERRVRRFVRTLRAEDACSLWPHGPVQPPEIWCMGSGARSLELAVQNGLSFAYSLFHRTSQSRPEYLEEYRRSIQTNHLGSAQCAVAAAIACAADDASAQKLVEQSDVAAIVPTVIGTPHRCIDKLHGIAERFGVNEVILLNLANHSGDRAKSFEELIRARDD